MYRWIFGLSLLLSMTFLSSAVQAESAFNVWIGHGTVWSCPQGITTYRPEPERVDTDYTTCSDCNAKTVWGFVEHEEWTSSGMVQAALSLCGDDYFPAHIDVSSKGIVTRIRWYILPDVSESAYDYTLGHKCLIWFDAAENSMSCMIKSHQSSKSYVRPVDPVTIRKAPYRQSVGMQSFGVKDPIGNQRYPPQQEPRRVCLSSTPKR